MASNNSSIPNINVPIRIEPTDEYKIHKIAYDGQEESIPPLSMSEHLSQQIQRIDFNQPIDELEEELKKAGERGEDDESEPVRAPAPSTQMGSSLPFESMITKLRNALAEICVLNDVLVIAKEKKYMVFDAVNPKQTTDQRPIITLMAKKKALSTAASILINGAQTLRGTSSSPTLSKPGFALSDTSSQGSASQSSTSANINKPNFYEELREMRQHWRLKRHGNVIVGDLSDFRPVGHRFVGNSLFKVTKTNLTNRGPNSQALSVEVSPELEGRAYIQVSIVRNNDKTLCDMGLPSKGRFYGAPKEQTWQEKLESAQNVLICNELFSHLANQAVQHQFLIPATITGNQIKLALFPDVKMCITLVHMTPNSKQTQEQTERLTRLQREHKSVFEHSLHQMFKDFYAIMLRKMQGLDIPREAGPCAIDKQTLFELSRQESSLDRIVQQAQHLVMRKQTMEVIDDFSSTIKDPTIITHWLCLNSSTTSIVRVDIVSHNREILGRSHMLIYIGTRQLRVITRDCKNLLLSYEPKELKHLLVWQSCLHQFIASDKLIKLIGWYTLVGDYNVNVTRRDMSSVGFSLIICSGNCSHLISIKSGPQFGLAVEVAQSKEISTLTALLSATNTTGGLLGSSTNDSLYSNGCSTIVPDEDMFGNSIESILSSAIPKGRHPEGKLTKYYDLFENPREVDWEMMPGEDFLAKLELLLGTYTVAG